LRPSGAGHFVKMVHNGIEYGLMAAYAEGLNILKHRQRGQSRREADAETTPLRNPEHYQYDFNLADVTEVWRRGSVVCILAARSDRHSLLEQPASNASPAACPTLAKAAGPSSRPSNRRRPHRYSALRSTSASPRAAKTILRESFVSDALFNSADTSKKRPGTESFRIPFGR